jgi:hypothetical protein
MAGPIFLRRGALFLDVAFNIPALVKNTHDFNRAGSLP